MKLFAILFVGCCLSNCASATRAEVNVDDLDGFDLTDEYRDLNSLLKQKTDETNPESNFEAALQIKELNLEAKTNAQRNMLEAVELFLALKTISRDGNDCNPNAANIIEQNSRATDRKALLEGGGDLDRIAGIVGAVARHHARECQSIYEMKFNDIFKGMDELKKSRVSEFLHDLIEWAISDKYESNVSKSEAQRYYNIVSWRINPSRKLFSPSYLYGTLKKVAEDDTESIYLEPVDKSRKKEGAFVSDKFHSLYEKYFVLPCEHYKQELGAQVFDQKDYLRAFEQVNENNPEFYKVWAQYHLCSEFKERSDSIFGKLIRSLLEKENNRILHQ